MPEGDTIYRTAAGLRSLVGQQVVGVDAAPRAAAGQPFDSLAGQTLDAVESRGKHLLLHASRCIVHSHMGMTGSWQRRPPGEAFGKPRRYAFLILEFESGVVAACFTPKTLQLLTPAQWQRHPVLQRLGPDLLSEKFALEDALIRLRRLANDPIGSAIMNQFAFCGVGNVFKSEILFATQVSPFTLVSDLDDETLKRILQTARDMLWQNRLRTERRTRWRQDGSRLWVYGRSGEPCLRCGQAVLMRRQGDLGRSTYYCPGCQPESG